MGLFGSKDKSVPAEFETQKSLAEISTILRQAATDMKADVERLIFEDDPLGDFENTATPDIAVLLSGNVGIFGGFKHLRPGSIRGGDIWGVQVQVFDEGDLRVVALLALGESNPYADAGVPNIGASKEKMSKLIELLS